MAPTVSGPSFTREVREELVRLGETRDCCRMAEIAGLVRSTGTFHIRSGASEEERYGLHLATTVQAAARIAYSHFKRFGATGELLTRREPRFKRRLIYEVHLQGSPATLQALNELGILSDSFRLEPGIPSRLLRRRCCRSAFLRGVLLGAGSVNTPQRDAHLEILTTHEAFAVDLADLLRTLGFHPGVYQRRAAHVVYLKGREEVAELLAFAGAQEAALRLEEEAVLKEVREQANRLANCDEANLRRTSRASQRQLDAISYLERHGILRTLPAALQEVAELRQEFAHLNLTELAAEGPEGLTRSAVNHRLRRLVEAAREAGWGD
jgi:cell division protein WhiA